MALTNAASELMKGAEKLSSSLDDTMDWDSRMQMTRDTTSSASRFVSGEMRWSRTSKIGISGVGDADEEDDDAPDDKDEKNLLDVFP
ncbi:hypothetical protein Pyn_24543 [Prunus yedoensis var. nudiflora]|uniref:Uncharacterized protein n=1 Tax=Prunus yedoensis var. nudiflora TaxID=2094558 RepID=A0A314USV7_PRUYE|nr:hypothetical protein Pyn_24543 [Prunus yedoensis var. nudiflora]